MVETREHFIELFRAPVTLMLVRLNPDHVNRNARIQAAVDQDLVVCGDVEVVDQQRGVRVRLAGGREHALDKLDAAKLLADTRDGVIIFIKDRHDHDLVDDVPHVDDAFKETHVAADTGELAAQNLVV